jgi:hypothetical protein
VTEFFNEILWFFDTGIFQFFESALVSIGTWYVLWELKALIAFTSLSWDIAKNILDVLSISSSLQSAWSSLDSQVLSAISWFRIPEGINILLNAYVTRFVISVL